MMLNTSHQDVNPEGVADIGALEGQLCGVGREADVPDTL
jgi:hypothetical protein